MLFLVAGQGKAEVLAKVRGGDAALPSTHVSTAGELVWVLDRTAAGPASRG